MLLIAGVSGQTKHVIYICEGGGERGEHGEHAKAPISSTESLSSTSAGHTYRHARYQLQAAADTPGIYQTSSAARHSWHMDVAVNLQLNLLDWCLVSAASCSWCLACL